MTDIDDRLHDYAQRWRTAQPAPPPPLPVASRVGFRHRGLRHPKRVALIAAAAIVVAAVAAVAAVRHSGPTGVPVATRPGVPVAQAPLVRHSLHATSQINLTTGRSGNIDWTFFAEYVPRKRPPGIGPGLCMGIAVPLENSSGCDNPTTMPSLTASIGRLQGDPNTLLITGVTSANAATFSISLGDLSLSTPALSSSALPGLRFYVLQIPATQYRPNAPIRVEAISADGIVLLRNDPRRTAPLLPPLPSNSSHGPQVIWPTAGSNTVKPSSALALARQVAEEILGIPNPTVTASADGYVASISIRLPTTGKELKGIAQSQPDHTWALIQLGDQSQLSGITYLPNGHPGPVMALVPPAGATQADVTEVDGDGTHHLHLTAADLATKTLHLPTNANVDSITIVYRNNTGAAIGALAGLFA